MIWQGDRKFEAGGLRDAHLVHEGGLVEGGAVGDVQTLVANLLLRGLQHLARLLLLTLLYFLCDARLLTLQPATTTLSYLPFLGLPFPQCLTMQ